MLAKCTLLGDTPCSASTERRERVEGDREGVHGGSPAPMLNLAGVAFGVYALIRAGHAAEACTLGAAIVYVTAVHFFILTEARQSLPAQPTLLVLAAFGLAHSFPFKPQVHEREHL